MDGLVLPSEGSAGEIVAASTVIAGVATGELKTGMNSSFAPVIVSMRSAKHKRQDLTHKIVNTENVNIGIERQETRRTVNSVLNYT